MTYRHVHSTWKHINRSESSILKGQISCYSQLVSIPFATQVIWTSFSGYMLPSWTFSHATYSPYVWHTDWLYKAAATVFNNPLSFLVEVRNTMSLICGYHWLIWSIFYYQTWIVSSTYSTKVYDISEVWLHGLIWSTWYCYTCIKILYHQFVFTKLDSWGLVCLFIVTWHAINYWINKPSLQNHTNNQQATKQAAI